MFMKRKCIILLYNKYIILININKYIMNILWSSTRYDTGVDVLFT